MEHYAKTVDGVVEQIIVADSDFFNTFVDTSPGTWLETKKDGSIRKNYANIGSLYDENADAFYDRQPWPSFTLNTTTYVWECPITRPNNGTDANGTYTWYWSEATYDADTSNPKTKGWIKKYYSTNPSDYPLSVQYGSDTPDVNHD